MISGLDGNGYPEAAKQIVTKHRGRPTGDALYVQYIFDKAADRR